MPLGSEHPTIDVLKLYSLERLNKGKMARVDEHLFVCAECRKRVSSLAGTTESTAVEECRRLFLKAAAGHRKIRLADSLRERVLVPTEKLWVELGLPAPNLPASKWTPAYWKAHESWGRENDRLLRSWAMDLHLYYDWVLSEAAGQLADWRSFPERKGAFTEILGYIAPQFHLEPLHFDYELKDAYRKRMKAKFATVLEAHIRDVKRLRSQLLPDRGSRAPHYRWAAERVCLDRNWNEIANANPVRVSWQAVCKAVQPILAKIGIPRTQPKQRKKRAS
jgi:hypothetical protein